MSKLFEKVRTKAVPGSLFDLSHERKMSLEMGYLYPCFVEEYYPGDTFQVNTEILMRVAPLIAPLMHRVDVFVHYFSVDNRLLWSDWDDFITGGEQGDDASVPPYFKMDNAYKAYFAKGRVPDYMGIPPMASGTTYTNQKNISALPFRAYTMIYNEYYRDQNLIDPIVMDKTGGLCSATEHSVHTYLRKRAWEKDYFTSCTPEPQKGTEIELPVGDIEPVYLNPSVAVKAGTSTAMADGTITAASGVLQETAAPQGDIEIHNLDTMSVSATTITDLRRAFRLQEWLEKNGRVGSRIVESIKAHWGSRLPDYRAHKPEYLGGGKQSIVISEVLNTSATATEPQANMAGHGVSMGNAQGFKKSFTDYGWVIGIMSVLPKTAYAQGVHKSFTRFDKFDYAWPEFAHIGEQEVTEQELWLPTDLSEDHSFGYQQRYAELKFKGDSIHGDFRDDLDHWHLGRIFSSEPVLNETFINCTPDTSRIFPVSISGDYLYAQVYHNFKAFRKLPYFSDPLM